jgi:hypothetical protein
MNLIAWLQELGRDADPAKPGFQASWLYIGVCLAVPIVIGLFVGFGLRAIERVFGIHLGKGGH